MEETKVGHLFFKKWDIRNANEQFLLNSCHLDRSAQDNAMT